MARYVSLVSKLKEEKLDQFMYFRLTKFYYNCRILKSFIIHFTHTKIFSTIKNLYFHLQHRLQNILQRGIV